MSQFANTPLAVFVCLHPYDDLDESGRAFIDPSEVASIETDGPTCRIFMKGGAEHHVFGTADYVLRELAEA